MADCGVAGIVAKDPSYNVAWDLYTMGVKLQHRGELSAGMCLLDRGKLHIRKGPGLVTEVFKDTINDMQGTRGEIHVRYATSGPASGDFEGCCSIDKDEYLKRIRDEAQPFYRRHGRRSKKFAIVWNGNLTNTQTLRGWLKGEHDYDIETAADTELLLHAIAISAKENDNGRNLPELFRDVFSRVKGAYSMVFMNGRGSLVAARDPFGLRPMCYGENDDVFAVASETLALESIGISDFKFVRPGSMLIFNNRLEVETAAESSRHAHCVFERDYFSHVASVMEGGSLYDTRRRLGRGLASIDPIPDKGFIVVPVPDTAKTAAKAYADEKVLEFVQEGIIKSAYGRGFTEPKRSRDAKMRLKYDVVVSAVKGRKVVIVDDSIVRGDTMEKILWLLYRAGAAEAHVRSTFPPVKYPCFYGIDFRDPAELAANKIPHRNPGELEEGLAAQFREAVNRKAERDTGFRVTVKYPSLDVFVNAMGMPKSELCCACLDGEYPLEAEHPSFCPKG